MEKRPHILVVGNDQQVLRTLNLILEVEGYDVSMASEGSPVLTLVEEHSPDLVIVDIVMPQMDGIEMCLYIRQWSPVPIIMLSTWGAGKDKFRGLDLDSDCYLTEPFGVAELMAWIEKSLHRNTVFEL